MYTPKPKVQSRIYSKNNDIKVCMHSKSYTIIYVHTILPTRRLFQQIVQMCI